MNKKTYAPLIYALCIMFWMPTYPLRGEVGGGWTLEFKSFFGPVKWHPADRRVPFGAQKTRGCINHRCINSYNSSISRTSSILSLLRGLPKGQMGHIAPQFLQLYVIVYPCEYMKGFNWSKRGISCNINKHNANPLGTAGQG